MKYKTVHCIGHQNLQTAIDQHAEKHWDLHSFTFCGIVEVQQTGLTIQKTSAVMPSFMVIFQRQEVVETKGDKSPA